MRLIVNCLFGVPGFLGPLLPPPHPAITAAHIIAPNKYARRSLFDFRTIATIRTSSRHNNDSGHTGPRGCGIGINSDGAVVVIVSVEEAPGVTLAGDTEQVASVGAPEQVRDTGFEKAPNCEPTETVSLAVCPA